MFSGGLIDLQENNGILNKQITPCIHIPISENTEGKEVQVLFVHLVHTVSIIPTETNTLSIEAKTDGNCTKPFGYTLSVKFTVT